MEPVLDVNSGIITRNQVVKFATDVFAYYNGKINIFNTPAKLYIDFSHRYGSKMVACAKNPNSVFLYPFVLERCMCDYGPYWFWFNIYRSLIHELFHIDQDVSYVVYSYNPAYEKVIEDQVEYQTYIYLSNHKNDLALFGLGEHADEYMDWYKEALSKYSLGMFFHRVDYISHMVSMIKDILCLETHDIITNFDKVFREKDSIIDIVINDVVFRVKHAEYCMPLEQLNTIMEDQYYRFNLHRCDKAFFARREDYTWVLYIEIENHNNMCNIISN